jgi:hypothetical protein
MPLCSDERLQRFLQENPVKNFAVAKRWQEAMMKIRVIRIFREVIKDMQRYGTTANQTESQENINRYFLSQKF